MKSIDLNSDLGESFGPWKMGEDSEMLSIVTSANVACGFHAGDPAGILRTLEAAKKNNVRVGAHIGYRDLVGFGRRNMDPTDSELTGDAIYQIGALMGLAKAAGTKVVYVKPHGALYNTIAHDMRQAKAVINAIKAVEPSLVLMALAGSDIIPFAREAGLVVVAEAFADRAYKSDGTLLSRREKGAVLSDPAVVAERMVKFVETGKITAIDGKEITLDAQSICLHGDSPSAVLMAKAVKAGLEKAGVSLKPFVD